MHATNDMMTRLGAIVGSPLARMCSKRIRSTVATLRTIFVLAKAAKMTAWRTTKHALLECLAYTRIHRSFNHLHTLCISWTSQHPSHAQPTPAWSSLAEVTLSDYPHTSTNSLLTASSKYLSMKNRQVLHIGVCTVMTHPAARTPSLHHDAGTRIFVLCLHIPLYQCSIY